MNHWKVRFKIIGKRGRRFAASLCVCLTVLNLPGIAEVSAEDVEETQAGMDADEPVDTGGAMPLADRVITDWKWADEEQILSWNEAAGRWEAKIHMPVRSTPAFTEAEIQDTLLKVLPGQITARLADGTEETVSAAWDFSNQLSPPAAGTGVGWTKTIIPSVNPAAGYTFDAGARSMNVQLELKGPRKFLNDWRFEAREETTVTKRDDGTWWMDVYADNLSSESVKKAIKKVLPERIYANGSVLQNEINSPDFEYDTTSGGKSGWLTVTWLLDYLDDMTFADGQTFPVAASYDLYWGVNDYSGNLIHTNLKLNICLHWLNLEGHIETKSVSDPEGAAVNLFDYYVNETYGKNPSEAAGGDILQKSDSHYRPMDAYDTEGTKGFVDSPVAFSTVQDWNQGINKGHLLIFGDGLLHAGLWNKGAGEGTQYGEDYAGMEGIVKPLLASDGYPVLNTDAANERLEEDQTSKMYRDYRKVRDYKLAGDHVDASGNGYDGSNVKNLSDTVIQTWGKTIGQDEESLDYLFDPDIINNYKETYKNVKGLFQVDDEGYYYYDMRKNFAEFCEQPDGDSDGHFVLYDAGATLRTDGEKSIGNFFPFNKGEEVFTGLKTNEAGNTVLTSAVDCARNTMNHHLGMTVDIDFRQPVDGTINMGKAGKKDMTFAFSGDDDVWVFIDDVLVLDLGGVHSEIYGTINFASGDVYIGRAYDTKGIPEKPEDAANMVTHTTLRELFADVGKDTGTGWNGNTFASNSDHKLRMFYLERGNYDSSIALRFNLQPRLYQQIKKVDHDGNPVAGVEFELYEARQDGQGNDAVYTAVGPALANLKTGADGTAEFVETASDGTIVPFNFSDRAAEGKLYYILKETKAPPGYRIMPEDVVLTYDTDTTLVLVVNCWSTGAYASFTETIIGNSSITYGRINPATGEINPSLDDPVAWDSQRDGLVVAVPMLLQQSTSKWKPLYGNNTTGLHTVDFDSTNDVSWRKAVLNAMLHQCSDDRSGTIHWFLEWNEDTNRLEGRLTDLPGHADRYQLTKQDGDMKVVYAIVDPKVFEELNIPGDDAAGRYEALGNYIRAEIGNGKTLDQITDTIYGVISGVHNRGFSFLNVDQFIRDFRSSVYIPNEQRELQVWKVDQDGKGVNGAVFGLYDNPSCSGSPEASGTTANVNGRDGVLIFAPNAGGTGRAQMGWNNQAGTRYYLKEMQAPPGHQINNTITQVVVGNYSIYADAGVSGDDVTVMAGVGKLAQTLSRYAADEEVDITLRDITAFGQIQPSSGFTLTNWNDMMLAGTSIVRSMNLHYGVNTTMHYGLHDEDGGKNLLPLFVTDTGFIRARIQQNYPALISEAHGSSTADTNKENLGSTDLTNLFSLLNIVVVTDRTAADTRTGELTVGKMVSGENLTEADYTRRFRFTIELTDAAGQELAGEYQFYGTDKSGHIRSGDTIPLHHDEKITILGLPEGTRYLVREEPADDWFTVPENQEIAGTILNGGTAAAMFINSRTWLDIGSLTLRKIVTGAGDTRRKFTFVVTFMDEDGNELAGDYPYLGAGSGRIASGDRVELKHHESITITELPAGTLYAVTELEADQDGYTTSMEGETGTILRSEETLAEITNYREREPEQVTPPAPDPPEEPEITGQSLPARSGGTGDKNNPFVWLLILCLSFGVITADLYEKRRKRL